MNSYREKRRISTIVKEKEELVKTKTELYKKKKLERIRNEIEEKAMNMSRLNTKLKKRNRKWNRKRNRSGIVNIKKSKK